jgi:hypothetical protein
MTYAIPADEKGLLANLYSAYQQNHRANDALSDEKTLARARAWLTRLLVDVRTLTAHTDWLCEAYQATFRPPLPRRLLDGCEPRQPESGACFPYHLLPPEHRIAQIVKEGVAQLPADEVAALLLNPCALWDLSDRINIELPEYWWPLAGEVGKEMAQDWGIVLRIPGVDS